VCTDLKALLSARVKLSFGRLELFVNLFLVESLQPFQLVTNGRFFSTPVMMSSLYSGQAHVDVKVLWDCSTLMKVRQDRNM
jgi:hypothetical protein